MYLYSPTHGIITNCGKAHLEGFGGIEGVRKGKGELYDYLRLHYGTAFVMWDYDYLHEMSKGILHVHTYGTSGAEVNGTVKQSEPFLQVNLSQPVQDTVIHTNLVGDYNLPNVLAAIAVGKYFSVNDEKIKSAIEGYLPSNSRSQLIEKGNNTIILDAYNANPSSMKAAIENFSRAKDQRKILVLGAMMELGPESKKEHEAIIQLIEQYNWTNVLLVGGDFKGLKHSFLYFNNANEAGEWIKTNASAERTTYLIKGSRSMKMETIVEVL
ncbi:MAG: Mur ligase family protein [Agriterribacter sp.]